MTSKDPEVDAALCSLRAVPTAPNATRELLPVPALVPREDLRHDVHVQPSLLEERHQYALACPLPQHAGHQGDEADLDGGDPPAARGRGSNLLGMLVQRSGNGRCCV